MYRTLHLFFSGTCAQRETDCTNFSSYRREARGLRLYRSPVVILPQFSWLDSRNLFWSFPATLTFRYCGAADEGTKGTIPSVKIYFIKGERTAPAPKVDTLDSNVSRTVAFHTEIYFATIIEHIPGS